MTEKMPIYRQLKENIKAKIFNGDYRVGGKIMSERQMAQEYGINRLTVRKAIDELIQEGYLSAAQGKGTFVSAMPKIRKKVEFGGHEAVSLSRFLRQSGFRSSRDVLSFKQKPSNAEFRKMFPDSPKHYELIRLSKIDGEPYALQICTFPASTFHDPERFDFGEGSLYTYMDAQGHLPVTIISEMEAMIIPEEYQDILNIPGGKLVFSYKYKGYDSKKKLVEFTKAYYKPEYTAFKYITEK
jgi:GntR family transcriptional regulator